MEVQPFLFAPSDLPQKVNAPTASTFVDNMRLPVHRWFRFSAGFSASWAESVIAEVRQSLADVRVFDPFSGSGTTLLAAESQGVESYGTEAHPFLFRIARAKLYSRSDPEAYLSLARVVLKSAANTTTGDLAKYPALIHKCYDDDSLAEMDVLRQAVYAVQDGSAAAELVWLTLVSMIRIASHANTAQWQYVLPNKRKKNPVRPLTAFKQAVDLIWRDMQEVQQIDGPKAHPLLSDARTCEGVPDQFANLVITSPPYPNNYDYADATRLEMSLLGEVAGWGDLQDKVRQYLVRSCSQHVPEKAINLDEVLATTDVAPIRDELSSVCRELAEVRLTKGGKKTYHLMVACYFQDLGRVWHALRRVCASPCRVCFVVGDSAPYGVYVPVVEWLGKQALAAGFHSYSFERTRDRNVKWKNRKHRVPLCEGRIWVEG